MDSALQSTHTALTDILGSSAEPIDVLLAAEEQRRFWRPASPKVILLAESHVYTTRAELGRSLRPLPQIPANVPHGFVRLVYSLGYGENSLLDRPIVSPRNSGTPQYWKIFQSCITPVDAVIDCAPIQVSRTPDARARLSAKIRVLTMLRDRGIWLVDASVAALYLPGQAKPTARVRDAALQTSWDHYTGAVVENANPAAIICIGVGVARSLRTRLNRLRIPWAGVHQPQAYLPSREHAAICRVYSAVCSDPRRIHSVPSVA